MIIKNDRILKSLQYNINLTVVIYKVSNTNIKYIHLVTQMGSVMRLGSVMPFGDRLCRLGIGYAIRISYAD